MWPYFDGGGSLSEGITSGHGIFSGLKITISSCLVAVVLLEAVIQSCDVDSRGFALLAFYNSICVIIVGEILPKLRVVVRCFFVNLELELAITHG